MYHWLFFLMTEIEAPLWRIALHMFIYAPEEKSEDEIALAKRDARRMIAVLEQHMQGRDFVVGERVTVDRKSTRLNSSHYCAPRMPSSACKKNNHMRLAESS